MPLTDRQITLVQETWKLVAVDLQGNGIKFFHRIFELAPEVLNLFNFKEEGPESTGMGLKFHALKVLCRATSLDPCL